MDDTCAFFAWFHRFIDFITRNVVLHVLLLLDNFSAHDTIETIPTLSNFADPVLHTRTKSVIHPFYAGIISFVKTKYKSRLQMRKIDRSYLADDNLYCIDKLTAFRWI